MGETRYMHWTHSAVAPSLGGRRCPMDSDEVLASEILGHGAYLCLRRSSGGDAGKAAAAPIDALAQRLGLRNEFDPGETPPVESIAFLRRQGATPADIADDAVLQADWVIHVASKRPETITELSAETARLLSPAVQVHVLQGVRRPRSYTGAAMNNWAYERQVVQQPGTAMPNAFLVPMSKTADWWRKDWMERHTYFLPRYDEQGRMQNEGHALVTEAGISCLLRRTYRNLKHPAPPACLSRRTRFRGKRCRSRATATESPRASPALVGGSSSVLARTLCRRTLPHRPDLDGARAGQWNSCGDGDGFVEILDVDEHVAAELLAGLRERTVGHEALAVAHPDAGRRRRRVQRGTAQILPARRELFRDLQGLPVDLLSLGHAEPVPDRLVAAYQQHVFHVGLHRYVERRGPESTPRRRLSNLEYAPGCKRSRRGGLSLRLGPDRRHPDPARSRL